ncbi:DUF2179 domain-containing protein [Sediminibacillus massiliensis]|uniref:DUF2179 domain-containing protein n=1 Tax=Sediminibacillus massiliensis TaxID=1926277 RepID=UPI0009887CCD|nr:DUF2179 domain-containing protein [Sediminibacillus massiliensis]
MEILLIFLIQLIYVPIMSIRIIFLVKNLKAQATVIGVVEAFINIFAFSLVLTGDQNIVAMLVYALGFGVGLYIGGVVENKLAVGYTTFIVNTQNLNDELIERLRVEGFGVTTFRGEGRDSSRHKLEILTKRRREEELETLVLKYEPNAFLVAYEPTKFHGGFLLKAMSKRRRRKMERQQNQSSPSEA